MKNLRYRISINTKCLSHNNNGNWHQEVRNISDNRQMERRAFYNKMTKSLDTLKCEIKDYSQDKILISKEGKYLGGALLKIFKDNKAKMKKTLSILSNAGMNVDKFPKGVRVSLDNNGFLIFDYHNAEAGLRQKGQADKAVIKIQIIKHSAANKNVVKPKEKQTPPAEEKKSSITVTTNEKEEKKEEEKPTPPEKAQKKTKTNLNPWESWEKFQNILSQITKFFKTEEANVTLSNKEIKEHIEKYQKDNIAVFAKPIVFEGPNKSTRIEGFLEFISLASDIINKPPLKTNFTDKEKKERALDRELLKRIIKIREKNQNSIEDYLENKEKEIYDAIKERHLTRSQKTRQYIADTTQKITTKNGNEYAPHEKKSFTYSPVDNKLEFKETGSWGFSGDVEFTESNLNLLEETDEDYKDGVASFMNLHASTIKEKTSLQSTTKPHGYIYKDNIKGMPSYGSLESLWGYSSEKDNDGNPKFLTQKESQNKAIDFYEALLKQFKGHAKTINTIKGNKIKLNTLAIEKQDTKKGEKKTNNKVIKLTFDGPNERSQSMTIETQYEYTDNQLEYIRTFLNKQFKEGIITNAHEASTTKNANRQDIIARMLLPQTEKKIEYINIISNANIGIASRAMAENKTLFSKPKKVKIDRILLVPMTNTDKTFTGKYKLFKNGKPQNSVENITFEKISNDIPEDQRDNKELNWPKIGEKLTNPEKHQILGAKITGENGKNTISLTRYEHIKEATKKAAEDSVKIEIFDNVKTDINNPYESFGDEYSS